MRVRERKRKEQDKRLSDQKDQEPAVYICESLPNVVRVDANAGLVPKGSGLPSAFLFILAG